MSLSKTERAKKAGQTRTAKKAASSRANGFQPQPDTVETAVIAFRVLKADESAYKGLDATNRKRIADEMRQAFGRLIIETLIV